MYTLKPIIALPERIPLPTVMYELPKIQGAKETIADDFSRQQPLPEINLLEARQMRILKQLCELKEQVEHLCVAVKITDLKTVQKSNAAQINIQEEVIVNANPASPPYFLLALQQIWKDVTFSVEIHRHSTASNATTDSFEQKLLTKVKKDGPANIDIKLIWKDVPDVQLISKFYDYPFDGEANALRYLSRLTEKYNYESTKTLELSTSTDVILDLCLQLPYEEPRNVNAVTSKLANYVGTQPWLLESSEPSIVDVAVWSVLKRIVPNRVPRELKNWYALCEKTFLSV